jgi:transposase
MGVPRKFPPELRDRAIALVWEMQRQTGSQRGAVARVAGQLGIARETLRTWVRRAEIDGGRRPGVTTDEAARIRELQREVAELRRANEILKAASAFFARELDPRLPRW